MLGNFEKRQFPNGEAVWIGHYKNLVNVLHWHFECEIIRVTKGNSKIKIGELVYDACEGDSFFCVGEKLHYVISDEGAETDVMIFSEEISKDITDLYALASPKISKSFDTATLFERVGALLSQKGGFYRQASENLVRGFVIELFSSSPINERDNKSRFYKNLITKINEEFAFITFEDAVRYSGYSASHFSKLFKQLSGMAFTEYLNIIRVENALSMLNGKDSPTATEVSLKCGFSTVRNFNKVFRRITGFSPKGIPKNYVLDIGFALPSNCFDPTDKASVLI